MASIFTFDSYKEYLADYLDSSEEKWGLKSRVCKTMDIHNAYLSQVLNGPKHLSLEQIEKLARFLGLNEAETNYLILLAQKNRAGTVSLEKFFAKKIHEVRKAQSDLSQRLGKKASVDEKVSAKYYSKWQFAALHVALQIESLRSPRALSAYFHISEDVTIETLNFLVEAGLAKKEGSKFLPTAQWMRLSREEGPIAQHHANARLKGLESVYENHPQDLHYSGFFSFSKADSEKVRDLFLVTLKNMQKIIEPSPSEEVFGVALDFFAFKPE